MSASLVGSEMCIRDRPSPASMPGAAGRSRGSAPAATVALSTKEEPRAASPLGTAAGAGVGGTAPPDS
eukprot:2847711-Alexandrium_andersonii.AAC.1